MQTKLILGGPGCGKTTALLQVVEQEMNLLPPQRIAFVAFTKAAAEEAKQRAAEKFSVNAKDDLPWFRTIHSLAYKQCGMMHDEVMQKEDWQRFSKMVGENVTGYSDAAYGSTSRGDQMLQVVDLARAIMKPLEWSWQRYNRAEVSLLEMQRFAETFNKFKKEQYKVDYTDMLSMYIKEGEPVDVTVAVIDEAQDLTPLQWKVVRHAFRNVDRLYLGGDDDQAIYQWAGADIQHFLSLDAQREVLPHSHRMLHAIFNFSQQIAARIGRRYAKKFSARAAGGEVKHYHRPEQVDFVKGTWLLLARNGYMLGDLRDLVRSLGLPYSTRKGSSVKRSHVAAIYGWEAWRKGECIKAPAVRQIFKALNLRKPVLNDARVYAMADFAEPFKHYGIACEKIWHEALHGIPLAERVYYTAIRRRKVPLEAEPRLRIETIHGVKGAEADHVLLLTDMAGSSYSELRREPDGEHRVFYVGCTRARRSLHVIGPQSTLYYPL